MKRNVAFLVDGAFYLKRHEKTSPEKHVPPVNIENIVKDLTDQCLKHLQKNEERLYRIFFYDCPALKTYKHHPLTNKRIDFSQTSIAKFRNGLHEELKQTPNVALRLGFLDERNGRWKIKQPKIEKKFIAGNLNRDLVEDDLVFHAQQKAVDMKIGIDIASLAYKKLVSKIVLVSGDSDFTPAAKLARMEGIEFVLDPMWASIKPDLYEHIDGLTSTTSRPK